MRRTNWKNFEKGTTELKRKIKNVAAVSQYLQEIPEEGFCYDNMSKKIVKISECKESTLRRFIKQMDKYYYLVSSQKDKNIILAKKTELEAELDSRDVESQN